MVDKQSNEELVEVEPVVEASETDAGSLRTELSEEAEKAEGYLANWQRAQADLSNYKKRAEQEKQELATFANAAVVASLLPVLDDLERALGSVDAKLARLTWLDGIKLIYRKLESILESQGLSRIETVGEVFDPTVHEAVMEVEGEDGKVVGEAQKGYRFRDRVIRPAMVQVGRGGGMVSTEDNAEEGSSNE